MPCPAPPCRSSLEILVEGGVALESADSPQLALFEAERERWSVWSGEDGHEANMVGSTHAADAWLVWVLLNWLVGVN